MRLVPVPKRMEWTVGKDAWHPVENASLKLRPLAHICLRDQTMATPAMICLANLIETEQGDSRLPQNGPPLRDHRRSVSSYGNRLYCRWKARRAEFH